MSINKINKDLIDKISDGEERAFATLYDSYYTYLNTVAIYYLFNRSIANEIVNDIFVNIWNNRANLTFPIHSYLVQSVRNRCLNHLRDSYTEERNRKEYTKQLLEYQEERILSNSTPLQYVETEEIGQIVLEAVKQLPERCRQIFECYFYQGKSVQEIEKELDINSSTVRVQIKNALDKLRVALPPHIFVWLLLLLIMLK